MHFHDSDYYESEQRSGDVYGAYQHHRTAHYDGESSKGVADVCHMDSDIRAGVDRAWRKKEETRSALGIVTKRVFCAGDVPGGMWLKQ